MKWTLLTYLIDKLQTLQIIDRQRVVARLTLESKRAPLVSRDTATLVVPFRFKKFSSYKPMHVLSTTVPSRHILLESYNHSKSERLIWSGIRIAGIIADIVTKSPPSLYVWESNLSFWCLEELISSLLLVQSFAGLCSDVEVDLGWAIGVPLTSERSRETIAKLAGTSISVWVPDSSGSRLETTLPFWRRI
jgi:hypothetical protein